jgi:hypothetical protein
MTRIIIQVRRSPGRIKSLAAAVLPCLILATGCTSLLVGAQPVVSTESWEMTLVKLVDGPDQYWTAGGYRRPRQGNRYVWATVRLRNTLKTPLVIRLDRVYLHAGAARRRPCVIDADCFITVQANPAPRLGPGETITRRLAYMLPPAVEPERLACEKGVIEIPAPAGR